MRNSLYGLLLLLASCGYNQTKPGLDTRRSTNVTPLELKSSGETANYTDQYRHGYSNNEFRLLSLSGGKLSLRLPKTWIIDSNVKAKILLIGQKRCPPKTKFCPNLTVSMEALPIHMTFLDYVNESITMLNRQLGNCRIIDRRQTEINGVSAFHISFLTTHNDLPLGGVSTLIEIEGKVYVVTGISLNEKDEFRKYKEVFLKISESIVCVDQGYFTKPLQ
jgi:hypothetical protein